jgi:endo-1,3-1,4-beta-glycanase ExoK
MNIYILSFFLLCLPVQLFCAEKELLGSAELYTEKSFTYGRFVVRMRMAAADGVISSFFLWKQGSEVVEVDGTTWNEIDIEVLGCSPAGFQSAIHSGTGGWSAMKHREEYHRVKKNLCTHYNTYSVEWTPDYIAWTLNDSLVRKDTGDMVATFRKVPMQLRFNIWPSLNPSWAGLFKKENLPKHQYINSVKYYTYTPGSDSGFTLAWEDDFSSDTLNARWRTGFWESPDRASTHTDKNITLMNGAAILTLSLFNKCGFKGLIPQDDHGGTTFPKGVGRGR